MDTGFQPNEIKIKCSDSFELSGALFIPQEIKAAVMIAPATGIKKRFYFSFARHLAEHGYVALTFDNRGIGDSSGKNINQVNASLVNWGKLDMTAALEYLKGNFPDKKYHLIGHSAGGQLMGLMENAKDLSSMFNFACSSGSIQNAEYPFKFLSFFFLRIFLPMSSFLFDQANNQWVGMGEPLPKLVAKEWSRWCAGKGYVKVDLGTKIKEHFYDEINIPTQWLHASDDDIANLENVKDMIRVYPKIESEIITLNPKKLGYPSIGHMSFFSSKKKELWSHALNWLDKF